MDRVFQKTRNRSKYSNQRSRRDTLQPPSHAHQPQQSTLSSPRTSLGTIYGTRAFTTRVLRDVAYTDGRRTGACIVNIASALGHRGGAGSSVYASTKAGIMSFSRSVAEELGSRGIRCNSIAPRVHPHRHDVRDD